MQDRQRGRPDFAGALRAYADAVATNFRLRVAAQPEDQLKAPVGELLRAYGRGAGLDVNSRTEVRDDDVEGRPDLGVTVTRLLTGHVELKRPGLGARPERFTGANRDQWNRFRALPNLVYTDGSEWSLYHSGQLVQRVRIADDVSEQGAGGLVEREVARLEDIFRAFLNWNPIVPGTARGLAEFLAPLTRFLREEVAQALGREGGPLRRLATEWRAILFPEADDAQVADAYAQTVTYALLLAHFEGAEALRPAIAVEALQRQHALLADALNLLEVQAVRDELLMPIELLERAIQEVDAARIERAGDPWIYFYEQFLGAYDPRLRKNRGVYYTPVEVVRAQVRLAAELLRTHFGKALAFADGHVVVLDPAVGTGTYPLAVLDNAADSARARLGEGGVLPKLRDLAERLYAFEILVGPYAVAHLRIAQRLREAGVTDRAAQVYLTDTLESPNQLPNFTASLLQANLTEERRRAQHVKKDVRVFVCLGNPPYDREQHDPDEPAGRRKGGWVRHGDGGADQPPPILEDFLAPVRAAGGGVHLKNLYNDYVYFWRWALWKVLDSSNEAGIVSFITASSYLRGPGFGGMRRKKREVFDQLWIIDLEGDSLGARKTENVFAIRTPVAIAIGVRLGAPDPNHPARIWKAKLTGTEREKLERLNAVNTFADLAWRECSRDWDAPFYPVGIGDYFNWPAVTDVFPWQQSGVKIGRTWPVSADQETLRRRWSTLLAAPPAGRQRLFVNRPTGRKVTDSPPRLPPDAGNAAAIITLPTDTPPPKAIPFAFRSHDRQYILADARLLDRPSPPLWSTRGPKQLYLTSLLTEVVGDGPAAVATAEVPDLHHFRGSFGGKHVIPLWRDAQATQPNVTRGLLDLIGAAYGRRVSPEDLFAYAYGILAQAAYVARFWDELELPPPRLPITKDVGFFERVREHGARLLYLHTYGTRFGGLHDDGSVPQGEARCTTPVPLDRYPENSDYDSVARILRVGEGEFAPVAPEVWAYPVSGLQVVKSWLDYRKLDPAGRSSSPLDDMRTERWDFTEELLELLWVLEHTVALEPAGAVLLAEVCASDLFSDLELPRPSAVERGSPGPAHPGAAQQELDLG